MLLLNTYCQVLYSVSNVAVLHSTVRSLSGHSACANIWFWDYSMESKFERIALNELRQGRRGKHNKLIMGILDEISTLADGEALKVPISALKGISIQKIRSALARAAASRDRKVATYSDDEGFYVWNRTRKTERYERNVKGRRA
jgi:hypothetical protein